MMGYWEEIVPSKGGEPWHGSPRTAAAAPSPEASEARLDGAWSTRSSGGCPCPRQRAGTGRSLRSLPIL